MFERSKTNWRIVATASKGDLEGTYEFIESWDETWTDILEQLFYDEFGVYPDCYTQISREKL